MIIDDVILAFIWCVLPFVLIAWLIAICISLSYPRQVMWIFSGAIVGALALGVTRDSPLYFIVGFIIGGAYAVCFLPPMKRQIGAGVALVLTWGILIVAVVLHSPYRIDRVWFDLIDGNVVLGVATAPIGRFIARIGEKRSLQRV